MGKIEDHFRDLLRRTSEKVFEPFVIRMSQGECHLVKEREHIWFAAGVFYWLTEHKRPTVINAYEVESIYGVNDEPDEGGLVCV